MKKIVLFFILVKSLYAENFNDVTKALEKDDYKNAYTILKSLENKEKTQQNTRPAARCNARLLSYGFAGRCHSTQEPVEKMAPHPIQAAAFLYRFDQRGRIRP